MMSTELDQYLRSVLQKYTHSQPAKSSISMQLQPIVLLVETWANPFLNSTQYSGSHAKGTAVLNGTDVDIFVSLSPNTPKTMKEIYELLFLELQHKNFNPRRQNVSIGLNLNGLKVDVVPAKQQDGRSSDHALYKSKGDTWTKTNVQGHINLIAQSGRTEEIRVLKIWRNQLGFSFPSFYLEMSVLEALNGKRLGALSENVEASLEYLKSSFITKRIIDPANTNNVISDDLTEQEKRIVMSKATSALENSWGAFVS